MNIDDFFNSENCFDECIKMTIEEFILKTRNILSKIDKEYGKSVIKRVVSDEEYKLADCDNCNGNCLIKINNKELECFNDENGDCIIKDFDNELFVEEV